MNSEERPATGPDRLQADHQHTVAGHPVKGHFAGFRERRTQGLGKTRPSAIECLPRRADSQRKNQGSVLSNAEPDAILRFG